MINHRISKDLYCKIYLLSKDLFDLPFDTKIKVGLFSYIKTYHYKKNCLLRQVFSVNLKVSAIIFKIAMVLAQTSFIYFLKSPATSLIFFYIFFKKPGYQPNLLFNF
jgi:hypothetical protein